MGPCFADSSSGAGWLRAVLFALFFVHGASGSAATLVVDSLADENSSSPANGTCTLREAILAANANVAVDGCPAGDATPGLDTILVPAGTISLVRSGTDEDAGETGDLDIASGQDPHGDVVIEGAGVGLTVIDANFLDHAFHVTSNSPGQADASIELRGLSIRDGGGGFGGGLRVGVDARAVLTDVEITNCEDGISNAGSLTATRVDVHTNLGDGIRSTGIFSQLTVVDSAVRQNLASGIVNARTAFITGSTVSGNLGDGVRTEPGLTPLTSLTNSTVSNNAIELVALGSSGFSSNVTVIHSTLHGPGLVASNEGFASFTFKNSILVGFCLGSGPWISEGGNVESLNTCGLVDPTDQPDVTPPQLDIGALGDNGGQTLTHALGPDSVAIDAAVGVNCPPTDQRGMARVLPCDAGSLETDGEFAILVDSTADENLSSPANGTCTLREAILAANTNQAVDGCRSGTFDLDQIIVPPGGYILNLVGSGDEGGDLDVIESVDIVGASAQLTIIDADDIDRVFEIGEFATVGIEGVTIKDGSTPLTGGGIHNAGTLSLRESSVQENAVTFFLGGAGAGIYNAAGAHLEIDSSTIHSNSAGSAGRGGGIFNSDDATLDATNSTISQNFAGNGGGGIRTEGDVALYSTTIADNIATSGAWGIDNAGSLGVVTLGNTLLDDGCSAGFLFSSLGGNLEVVGATCGLTHPTDQPAVPDAAVGLGLLGSNGGPTMTHRIPSGSAARGAALSADCPTHDQRGRPRDASCDVGAYEFKPKSSCGLGFEGALALLPLFVLRRGRAARRG